VKLVLRDGIWIGRGKGKLGNVYALSGRSFKSFGQGVPDPVVKVLQLSEINFQGQHDSPFWFGESAPEVSRQLNRVIDLSVIDRSMARAAQFVRTARETAAVCQVRLQDKREVLRGLSWQKRRAEDFARLKLKWEELGRAEFEHGRLGPLVSDLEAIRRRNLEARAAAAKALRWKATKLVVVEREMGSISGLILEIDEAGRRSLPVPSFRPVLSAHAAWRVAERTCADLSELVGQIFQAALNMKGHGGWAESLRKKIEAERCPLCGRKNE
jgi:hypothetical protein